MVLDRQARVPGPLDGYGPTGARAPGFEKSNAALGASCSAFLECNKHDTRDDAAKGHKQQEQNMKRATTMGMSALVRGGSTA